MKISLSNFRCFSKVENITIKPLTILVGENSVGKTSFLAATRFIYDLIQNRSASFNRSPYFLGAFEQLGYLRAERRRAKSFSFDASFKSRQSRYYSREPVSPRDIETNFHISFNSKSSQPVIENIVFDFEKTKAEFSYSKEPFLEITRPDIQPIKLDNIIERSKFDNQDYNLEGLWFLLSYYRLNERVDEDLRKTLDYIGGAIRGLGSNLPHETFAFAPVRTKPERTYNPIEATAAPGGDHIPMLLAQIQKFDPQKWEPLQEKLNGFGKAAGLFSFLEVKRLSNSESGPFQIFVDVGGRRINLIDVGYGVSQCLPLVVDLIRAENKSLFLLQQPEVHLHPVAQAELASLVCQIIEEKKHTVLVETHSDYFLDRIRMDIRDKKNLSHKDVIILYFERDGADVHIHEIEIDEAGNLINTPGTYRQFFLKEMLRSLDGGLHNN